MISVSLDDATIKLGELFDAVMNGEMIRIIGTGSRDGQVARLSAVKTGREQIDAAIEDWIWAPEELVHTARVEVWNDGCPACFHQTDIEPY